MKSLLFVLVVLVLLSCVPPGKMKYPPCAIINSEGRGSEEKAGLGWRKLKQEGMWTEMDTLGCSRRWREDALKGHIAGGGSLQWRRWFWILAWGVCEVWVESCTDGIGRNGTEKKHETFRRQVGFGSGRGNIPSELWEFALLSQLPELLFSHGKPKKIWCWAELASRAGCSKVLTHSMTGSLGTFRIYILWTETSNLIIPRRVHWSHWSGGSHCFACSLLGSAESCPDLHIQKVSLKGQVWSTQRQAQMRIVLRLPLSWVAGHGALCCCGIPPFPEGCLRANGHMAGKFACQWHLVILHCLFPYCKDPVDGSMNRLGGETDG